MIDIGPYNLNSRAVLAPMAGVTDLPFRKLCRRMGAAAATTEMTASNPALRNTLKSQLRTASSEDSEPRIVQIVGTDAAQMAQAAVFQVDQGAQVIDINMGCPAKKVCKKLAGSALLKDEALVADILTAVVDAVTVPVTLKIRTGWSPNQRNAVTIAKIAESCGVRSLAVHGRTRACRFLGNAEYDTIAEVVQVVDIPVFANGDITSAITAKSVLDYTRAAGVMIGRGAQGNPWIFKEINKLLNATPALDSQGLESRTTASNTRRHATGYQQVDSINRSGSMVDTIKSHLNDIYRHYAPYGHDLEIKIARKHVGWYLANTQKTAISTVVKKQLENRPKTGKIKTSCRNSDESSKTAIQAVDYSETRNSETRNKQKYFNRLTSQTAQLEFIEQFFGEIQTGETAA